jgi:hypothetical protein
MSLQKMIVDLLQDIYDPEERMKIASSINLLKDVFARGRINFDQLKAELTDIIASVYAFRYPGLTYEELRERAAAKAEEMARAVVLSTLSSRVREVTRSPI